MSSVSQRSKKTEAGVTATTKIKQGDALPPLPVSKEFKEQAVFENLAVLNDFLCYNIPPGKPWIPMHYVANFTKGTMMIYLFALMCYYENFSLGAWVYLALHGNYGIIWFLKDRTFPDAGFNREATTMSAIFPIPIVLIPYYFIGYWMMSGGESQKNPSYERIFIAIQLYCLGVVFMVLTDAQKFLVLRERRGLITHCMNGWSRNMNYFGEMMLYASFGVLCQRTEVWYIFAYVWTCIFYGRMMVKEYSLSKKVKWPEYKAKTWFFLPKLYSSTVISLVVYSASFGAFCYAYTHGGIEATVKSFRG